MNTTTMKYVFLDKLTYADVAFEAYGANLNELFASAALATTESMVDLSTVQHVEDETIVLESDGLDDLLFSFLERIIFLKDANTLFLSEYDVHIRSDKGKYFLTAECSGDHIDPASQTLHNDVKAVTYHKFKIEKVATGWKATIILDV